MQNRNATLIQAGQPRGRSSIQALLRGWRTACPCGRDINSPQIRARSEALYAAFAAPAERRRALAGSLSGGQRKRLGVAKALAGNPVLLVMDEPSSGLSPLFVKEVIRLLGSSRTEGLSLLIAEQNVKFLDLADRVYTLEGGRIGYAGSVAAMQENDALRKAYVGLK
jgi:branched-chain amino acid transport system ATP-binding protein